MAAGCGQVVGVLVIMAGAVPDIGDIGLTVILCANEAEAMDGDEAATG